MVLVLIGVPGLLVLLRVSVSAAQIYTSLWTWILVSSLAACQALLLFLSVDTSFRRLRPRRHLAVTAALSMFFAAVLVLAGVFSLDAGLYGDESSSISAVFTYPLLLLAWLGIWLAWAMLFCLHLRGSPQPVSAAVAWLLKGSVMELQIAVPAHVVARQRGDCSAPVVTSFGIVTGIAIMLFAFGPGVLALYKKRYDAYCKVSDPN